ncbi:MAG: hypothetical protein CYG60_07565 [Actinobacteria bacterium]|nr:MAG: hypothetical protein CYG60_07565 [Actinomycetota bacterium]
MRGTLGGSEGMSPHVRSGIAIDLGGREIAQDILSKAYDRSGRVANDASGRGVGQPPSGRR